VRYKVGHARRIAAAVLCAAESLLVVQKIGEKVHDDTAPIKFPVPVPDQYHVVIVDMRGHLGGGDIEDWKQIAYGTEHVASQYQEYWLDKEDRRIPLPGVWHPENRMRFAATARERLHAIIFVAEKKYSDDAFSNGAWIACNPHLFPNEATARTVFALFPLWKPFQCHPNVVRSATVDGPHIR
jgi:hypothetical protein